ncbi:hypothetical protein Syun_015027 [Stephania yunnanensis]|uniref:Uncharacterized protein n=1 Tax=Stephania yunnanensis TaxID=152371 RepID=A0AAP0P9B7_9MAGN
MVASLSQPATTSPPSGDWAPLTIHEKEKGKGSCCRGHVVATPILHGHATSSREDAQRRPALGPLLGDQLARGQKPLVWRLKVDQSTIVDWLFDRRARSLFGLGSGMARTKTIEAPNESEQEKENTGQQLAIRMSQANAVEPSSSDITESDRGEEGEGDENRDFKEKVEKEMKNEVEMKEQSKVEMGVAMVVAMVVVVVVEVEVKVKMVPLKKMRRKCK